MDEARRTEPGMRSSGPATLDGEPVMAMGRRRFIARAGCAVGLLAAGPAALGALGRTRQAGTLPDSPLGWVEIRAGHYATTDATTGGNCLLIPSAATGAGRGAGRAGSVLIDTKFPAFARQILRDAERLTGEPIAAVVNTHHHGDHVSGNIGFTDAPRIAHRNALPRIAGQTDRHRAAMTGGARQVERVPERFQEQLTGDLAALLETDGAMTRDLWTPAAAVGDGVSGLSPNARWVELHAFGHKAHTDNDVVIVIPGQNIVHTGDLVFNGLFPFFDPDGGGTARGWMAALNDIIALCDAETVVVPGHGPITDVDGVRKALAHLEQLWAAVSAEVEKGTPLDEVKAMTWPFMEGLGFESIRERGNEFVYNEVVAARE